MTNERASKPTSERHDDARATSALDWESKVIARIRARVQQLTDPDAQPIDGGWEARSLQVLREHVEQCNAPS